MIFIAEDALDAGEFINEVFQKYHRLIIKGLPNETSSSLINTTNPRSTVCNQNGKNTMDELNEIFANGNNNFDNNGHTTIHSSLGPTSILLQPTPIPNLTSESDHSNKNCFSEFNQNWSAIKELSDIPSSSSEEIPSISAKALDQLLSSCKEYVIHISKRI